MPKEDTEIVGANKEDITENWDFGRSSLKMVVRNPPLLLHAILGILCIFHLSFVWFILNNLLNCFLIETSTGLIGAKLDFIISFAYYYSRIFNYVHRMSYKLINLYYTTYPITNLILVYQFTWFGSTRFSDSWA